MHEKKKTKFWNWNYNRNRDPPPIFFLWSWKNTMLVSHKRQEHILNTKTKKTKCLLSHFHKTERFKTWTQNLLKNNNKKTFNYKGPSLMFFTLSSAPISHNYSYTTFHRKKTLEQREEGMIKTFKAHKKRIHNFNINNNPTQKPCKGQ